ncbi:molybdopterin-dependent oxidoreductase [Shimia sp. R9_1]|uniref:molybdopterin-dependent oxidoreductase n=1 Tax=unclassified Shimia TaxID=2630038 RepID=UPI0032AEF739
MNMLKSVLFSAAAAACLATSAASETILAVYGDVATSSDGGAWSFSAEDLRTLPSESFQTETIWTEGEQTFVGVPLHSLLEHVGASNGKLIAIAANDYAVSIPTSDAVPNGPIVAYLRNGEEMSLRDKGPLWIVYPFAGNAAYKSEEYYSRSIWQLSQIEVVAN